MGRKYVKIEDDVPFDITIENAAFGIGSHRKIVKAAQWNFECCDCHLVHNVSLIPSKHKIKILMHRDNRATAQLRRHANKEDEDFHIRGRNLK